MSIRLFASLLILLTSSAAHGQNPNEPVGPTKPVEVVNESLTVEGEVNAVLDEPVEVELNDTVGVDVLSTPATSFGNFLSIGSNAAVRGDLPILDYVRPFSGVLQSLQVQFHRNGIRDRLPEEPGYRAFRVSCRLEIYATLPGEGEYLIYAANIVQDDQSGASGVVNIPDLELRGAGAIRTYLEYQGAASPADPYGPTPICFLRWVALGTK